jgi:hypothetical protein
LTRCYLCNKKLDAPLFGMSRSIPAKIPRIVDGQQVYFCLGCSIRWNDEQKERAIATLYEGKDPIPYFMLPGVSTQDPSEKNNIFVGHLLFTDKAICFLQMSEYSKKAPKEPKSYDVSPEFVFFMYGAVGLLAYSLTPPLHGKAFDREENIKAAWRQVETPPEFKDQQGLKATLEKAHKLFLFPKSSITHIGYNPTEGLEIHTSGRLNQKVFFSLNREIYDHLEPQIKEYLCSESGANC